MTAPQAAETDELLTIDELAARTGMTVRTVRFYAGEFPWCSLDANSDNDIGTFQTLLSDRLPG